MGNPLQEQNLFEKILALPEEKIAEVGDFVDFLRYKEDDRRLVQTASRLSEGALRKVWDNTDDAHYDSPLVSGTFQNINVKRDD